VAVRLGITGAAGMLGWHLRCALVGREGFEVAVADRATFGDDAALADFARDLDVLVHCAGMNRGDEQEVHDVNLALAERLLAACDGVGATPHLVFTNSTHIERDTLYGASKRGVAAMMQAWAVERGVGFDDLVLPHVFGEHGRAFYNSVVHTFCQQLAVGDPPRIDHDGELELLHAADVADLIIRRTLDFPEAVEQVRVPGRAMRVSELLRLLQDMREGYVEQQLIPDLRDPLHLSLFNVLRAAMWPQAYPVPLTLHTDDRGSLFEAVKGAQGGQSFVSTTKPGITRGNHFHRRKVERFLVVEGEASIRLRRLFDDQVVEFRVSGDQPAYVDMPTLHTHNITNVGGGTLLTLFWSHEVFDPEQPDTVWEEVP
jgi:UDP-2-acetamido-2,6-beta-L-arabino-hexul-4-ose reductase